MRNNFHCISQFSHNLGENANTSPHQQRCDRLLQSQGLRGWEILFVRTLRDSKSISRKDGEKLAAIADKIAGLGGEADA